MDGRVPLVPVRAGAVSGDTGGKVSRRFKEPSEGGFDGRKSCCKDADVHFDAVNRVNYG